MQRNNMIAGAVVIEMIMRNVERRARSRRNANVCARICVLLGKWNAPLRHLELEYIEPHAIP